MRRPRLRGVAYSWLPGAGLNLIKCSDKPPRIPAEQTTLVEVAAIAAVPVDGLLEVKSLVLRWGVANT